MYGMLKIDKSSELFKIQVATVAHKTRKLLLFRFIIVILKLR